MKNQTCCFTGHRIIPENQREAIQERLEAEIKALIHQGVRYFGANGVLGFSTVAALTVLKLKQEFPHIRLILALPWRMQTNGWDDRDIKTYNLICRMADKVVCTSENYYPGCIRGCNRHLVKCSNFCICYLSKATGVTVYAVKYARIKGLQIINVAYCSSD